MRSQAATVQEYLAQLPAERAAVLEAVRAVIRENLDSEYEEGMQYGMIGYYVPHRVYPAGYHCDPRQPLPFAGLAAQKNCMSLYLMGIYGNPEQESWFRAAWARTGKRLDMGKACLRFKKLDDLALDVIGQAVRRIPARTYIANYEATVRPANQRTAEGHGLQSPASRRERPQAVPPVPARPAAKASRAMPAKRRTSRGRPSR